jgi:hypothetical protein
MLLCSSAKKRECWAVCQRIFHTIIVVLGRLKKPAKMSSFPNPISDRGLAKELYQTISKIRNHLKATFCARMWLKQTFNSNCSNFHLNYIAHTGDKTSFAETAVVTNSIKNINWPYVHWYCFYCNIQSSESLVRNELFNDMGRIYYPTLEKLKVKNSLN